MNNSNKKHHEWK